MMILAKDGIRSIDARAISGLCIQSTKHEYIAHNICIPKCAGKKYVLIGYINQAQLQLAGNNIELLGTYETLPEAKRILVILTDKLQHIKDIPYGTFDVGKL